MDFSRIRSVIDVDNVSDKKVTHFGAGAAAGFIGDLCRRGVRRWRLVDPDRIGPENIARQGHGPADIGRFKVDAVRDRILEISPYADVELIPLDCTELDDPASKELFGDSDLFIAATDSFRCQAYVNRLALMTPAPAVFIGIYEGGTGGEVVWIDPRRRLTCLRCLCSRRYEQQARAASSGISADPSSQGADIFSVRIPDAIAGQICIGLLTQGANNRYGRLIEQLGDRQFLQTTLSPEFEVNGRDIVRAKLGIGPEVDAYFAWNTIALADPDRGQLPCPDCQRYRGHQFVQRGDRWTRITTPEESACLPAAVEFSS